MTKFIATTLLLTALLMPAAGALAGGDVYRLRVDGLACPFCAYGIEKKLSGIKGVENLAIDMEAGMVIVTMADGVSLGEEAVRKAVEEAGFSLRGFKHAIP